MIARVEKACRSTVTKIARSQYLCMGILTSWRFAAAGGSWCHAIAFCRIDESRNASQRRIGYRMLTGRIHACHRCHLAPSLEYSDWVATPQPLNLNWMDTGRCDYGTRRCLFFVLQIDGLPIELAVCCVRRRSASRHARGFSTWRMALGSSSGWVRPVEH